MEKPIDINLSVTPIGAQLIVNALSESAQKVADFAQNIAAQAQAQIDTVEAAKKLGAKVAPIKRSTTKGKAA